MAKLEKPADNTYLSKDEITEIWGENFVELNDDPKIKFLNDKIIVLLGSPAINTEGNSVEILEIEEPTGADLERLDAAKNQTFKTASILVEVCGNLNTNSVKKMKSRDLLRIAKVGFRFLA